MGVTVVIAATVTTVTNDINGAAYVGVLASIIGYTFGRAHNEIERKVTRGGK